MDILFCQVCQRSKPITSFTKNKKNKSGYGSPCKACKELYHAIRRSMKKWPKLITLVVTKPADAQQCMQCQHTKPLDQFRKERRRHNGKSQICISCAHENNFVQNQRTHEVPGSKRCLGCQIVKPIDAFGIQIKTKDGHATQCRECLSLASIDYRARRRTQRQQEWAQWAATHQPELQEYRRTHAEQIAEKGRRWSAANREREAAVSQRRNARKRNLPDTWTTEQLTFMLEYWQYACAACGNPKGLFWLLAHDHWVPLASPDCPGTIATNMIPLCHGTGGCNNSKNGTDPHDWLLQRFGPKKAAKIEKAIATYFALVAERFGAAVA